MLFQICPFLNQFCCTTLYNKDGCDDEKNYENPEGGNKIKPDHCKPKQSKYSAQNGSHNAALYKALVLLDFFFQILDIAELAAAVTAHPIIAMCIAELHGTDTIFLGK